MRKLYNGLLVLAAVGAGATYIAETGSSSQSDPMNAKVQSIADAYGKRIERIAGLAKAAGEDVLSDTVSLKSETERDYFIPIGRRKGRLNFLDAQITKEPDGRVIGIRINLEDPGHPFDELTVNVDANFFDNPRADDNWAISTYNDGVKDAKWFAVTPEEGIKEKRLTLSALNGIVHEADSMLDAATPQPSGSTDPNLLYE